MRVHPAHQLQSAPSMGLTRRQLLIAGVSTQFRKLGAAPSRVAVVRAADSASYAAAIDAAVSAAGGLGFVEPGERVLLKPAVNSTNPYPATTDPETVLCVARLVRERGGKPFVADRTMFLHSTKKAFEKTRIRDAAEEARMPCLALDDAPVVQLRDPRASAWPSQTVPIYRAAVEADHVISLCTPRTHKLGDITMALKNSVGLVSAASRPRMHFGHGFKDRLAEISLVMRPSFVVMDARLGFADGGPDEGALVRPGLIIAGADPVAIDAVGAALLRLHGARLGPVWSIPILRRAAELGLGANGPHAVELIGADPALRAAIL